MLSAAAITITSRTQPWRSASSTIRPSRGSIGRRASCRPTLVSRRSVTALRLGCRRLHRAELLEQQVAVADRAAVGRVEERERGDVAETQGGHLQDDRGEVGAQDLRLGERWAIGEVVLVVEADADARRDAAAAAGALVRRGLRDRLDRQPLHLQPMAVARDARRARVDHVAHARHGQRRLGDVGGQHDAPAAVRLEDAVLLDADRRAYSGSTSVSRQVQPAQRVGGVVDLALAAEEHEHVARPFVAQLVDGVAAPPAPGRARRRRPRTGR